MFFFDNPVMQRELLVNLRMGRSFLLLMLYQVLLGMVVLIAWPRPEQGKLDLTADSKDAQETRALVNLFFQGQFVLASLMAPSFAAGTITGEKERHTYEMLLASPLKPAAIVWGKLFASLAHLAILIFASLPIVMLCLPLGGVSLYEVLAAYFALILSVATFGMISVACSAYFQRTSASLVVSYLLILPPAILGAILWRVLQDYGGLRLSLIVFVLPPLAAFVITVLFVNTSLRLLHPPDVGAEGNDVVDLEHEAETAVGLVIQRDQFPDRLFAPEKRDDLLPDDSNPVYEKEIRSEIFAQGTLMLRLVIQVSMLLAIPLMACCLYIFPQYCALYISYVVLFNMLVGPVYSAGSVTSERERETLDLLLTTVISPWQILWGKLVAGLRISSVLTLFLVWPLFLACVMVNSYWRNLLPVGAFLAIVLMTCTTTAMLALFFSVLFQKTSVSLMTTYFVIIGLFCAPVAAGFFTATFNRDPPPPTLQDANEQGRPLMELEKEYEAIWTPQRIVRAASFTSPFAAALSIPLDMQLTTEAAEKTSLKKNWYLFGSYIGFTAGMNLVLLLLMIWMFNTRWRVAG